MFKQVIKPVYHDDHINRKPWYVTGLRIFLPVILSVFLFLTIVHFMFIPVMRRYLLSARREMIQAQATTVTSLLNTYQQRIMNGELMPPDAQERARRHIENLRYGPELKDYFWIQDTNAVMLMHPYRPDLVGSNLYGYEDPTGKRFFEEMSRMAETQGYGFVDYVWQWMDDTTQQVPKVSYIVKYDPWGWVLGTGMYVQDLERKVSAVRAQVHYVIALLFGILLLISAYITYVAIRAERRRWKSDQLRAVMVGILESTSDLVSMSNIDKDIVFMNSSGKRMLGWPEDADYSGKAISDCHSEETFKQLQERAIPEAMRKGVWSGTTDIMKADGSIVPVSQVIMSHRDAEGHILYLSTIIRDISRIKQFEDDLRSKNEELRQAVLRTESLARKAEEASTTKSLFLANMSHELRTPLNAIIGCVDLLMETTLSGEQQELAKTIYTSGEVLFFTISDILDLSKIESGKISKEETAFRLRDLVDECDKVVAPFAGQKGVELYYDIDPDIAEYLYGDNIHLRQTLLNLLNNAVKFTDTGSVKLVIRQTSHSAGGCNVCFQVFDTGIGLDPDEMDVIFEPFRQSDRSLTRKYAGTGLGLAICREFVRMMGGQLKVESTKGEGSCFFFELMLRVPIDPKGCVVPNRTDLSISGELLEYARTLKMMIVEDNTFNRMVTGKMLHTMEIKAEEACDGAEAVSKHAQTHYDIIFMDIQMPVMDGIAATKKIRETDPSVYIIGLTAYAYQADRDECLKAGMNAYLSKPVKKGHLTDALHKALQELRSRS